MIYIYILSLTLCEWSHLSFEVLEDDTYILGSCTLQQHVIINSGIGHYFESVFNILLCDWLTGRTRFESIVVDWFSWKDIDLKSLLASHLKPSSAFVSYGNLSSSSSSSPCTYWKTILELVSLSFAVEEKTIDTFFWTIFDQFSSYCWLDLFYLNCLGIGFNLNQTV